VRDEPPAVLQAVINMRNAQQVEGLLRVRHTVGY
jgi:hypothetical protein